MDDDALAKKVESMRKDYIPARVIQDAIKTTRTMSKRGSLRSSHDRRTHFLAFITALLPEETLKEIERLLDYGE